MTLEVRIAHAFKDFALDIGFATKAPGVTALFGPSGAGKSTIINAVAGLFRPRTGRVAIEGDVLFDTASGAFTPPRRRRMGYVFQDARLFPHLSVRENLLFGWRRSVERGPSSEIDHVIDLLGLSALLSRLPRTLSGGEKQRVALGRALLASPRLLLMDEPLAALGQAMKDEILPYFERLRDEHRVPMLYVSHSVEEVARLADQVILIEAGRITAQGSVFDVFSALSPATRELSSGAVIEARVARHRPAERLTELAFGDVILLVPEIRASEGTSVRLRVLARDITIALDPPSRISANNVLPVTIQKVESDGSEVDLLLMCGNARLIARITAHSAKRLSLVQGMPAYAIIKSVTVDQRMRP